MHISKLRIFVEAVKLGSFSKAAEKCSYTPSALSHIADSIETELGVTLIRRNFNGITLTEEGKLLFPYLEKLLLQSEEIKTLAKTLQKQENVITIGVYSSISKYLLPDLMLAFKKAYPEVTLSVVVGNSVFEMIEKKADVFFAAEKEDEHYSFLPIYSDTYVAVVKEEYFLDRKVLQSEDFKQYPFILPESHQSILHFQKDVKEVLKVISDDDEAIVSMVKNGLGISVLPALSVKKLPKGVKTIKISPKIDRTLGILYPNKTKNVAIKKFLHFVQQKESL